MRPLPVLLLLVQILLAPSDDYNGIAAMQLTCLMHNNVVLTKITTNVG